MVASVLCGFSVMLGLAMPGAAANAEPTGESTESVTPGAGVSKSSGINGAPIRRIRRPPDNRTDAFNFEMGRTPTLTGGLFLRNGRGLNLQPQQGKLDPLTDTTIIEVAQRKLANTVDADLGAKKSIFKFGAPRLLSLPSIDPGNSWIRATQFNKDAEERWLQLIGRPVNEPTGSEKFLEQKQEEIHSRTLEAQNNFELLRPGFSQRQQWAEQQLEEMDERNDRVLDKAYEEDRATAVEMRFREMQARQTQEMERLHLIGDATAAKVHTMHQQAHALAEQTAPKLPELADPLVGSQSFVIEPSLSNKLRIGDTTEELVADANYTAEDNWLSWDSWYSAMGEAIKQPLIFFVNKHPDAVGYNSARVTVYLDGRIDVIIEKPSNTPLDDAVLEAYKQLSFDAVLRFPPSSRRKSVTYFSDHIHRRAGLAMDVTTRPLTGDIEHHVIRK